MKRVVIVGLVLGAVFFSWVFLSARHLGQDGEFLFTNTNQAALSENNFIRGNTQAKEVALTFDADMTPRMLKELNEGKVKSWYNQSVINVLRQNQVPATLFLTGLWIKAYPEITTELSQDPLFELGNHSYTHGGFSGSCYHLNPIKNDQDRVEIQDTEDLLAKYATAHQKYFRFPGLCSDAYDLGVVKNLGYQTIGGDVIGGDGFTQNAAAIAKRVVSRVKPGSIVILHMHGAPDAPATALALPTIISDLKAKGYTFVKVSQLLGKS